MRAGGEGGDDPRVGTVVAGRYFVHRSIGRGGMADVYEATRLQDEHPVALKVLRSQADDSRIRRFEREASAAARLRHPNCVTVVESGRDDDGVPFLVMELVRGRDLARVLRENGPLPLGRAGRVADQVLAVLDCAHGAGVIHRDLKPANVMVESTGDGSDFVKVLDFGIAAFMGEDEECRLTREGVAHGTPAYMSPEQIRGEPLDARSDLYAVGAILFEMLAGTPPFEAPSPMAVAALQLTEAAPPVASRRPEVPTPLAALVARALDRDRTRRPASAFEMREILRGALDGVCEPGPAAPRPLPPTEAFPVGAVAPARNRPRRVAILAGGVLAAASIAAALTLGARATTQRQGSTVSSPVAETLAPAVHSGRAIPEAAPEPVSPTPTPGPPPAADADARALAAPPPRAFAAQQRALDLPVPSVGAHPAPSPVAPPPMRVVRGELDAVPTPPAAIGDGVLVRQDSTVSSPVAETLAPAVHSGPAKPEAASEPVSPAPTPAPPPATDADARTPARAPARASAARPRALDLPAPSVRTPPAPSPVAPPPIRDVRGELDAVPTPPAATGDGVLVLQATPWAMVSIAGSALGETPREVRLASGTYDVRAVHPELGSREDRVAVHAGERTLWTVTFEE